MWNAAGAHLEPKFRIPSFGELEGKTLFADVRAAWNRTGLSLTVRVAGKKQTPWCRPRERKKATDCTSGSIRETPTTFIAPAATATGLRFCLPVMVRSSSSRWPRGCRSTAHGTIRSRWLRAACRCAARCKRTATRSNAHVPAAALTGFDPAEYPRLGFCYAVVDRELGWQTFNVGTEFPFEEDPSLWGSLELEPAE